MPFGRKKVPLPGFDFAHKAGHNHIKDRDEKEQRKDDQKEMRNRVQSDFPGFEALSHLFNL